MVLLFSFFFCSGGFLVAHADSANVLDWSVNKGDNVKPDDYYSGRSFDFVQHDDWCSDVRSPEELPPTRWQQEKILFEPLTGEQLSLLESSEQVPVPWDM